MTSKYSSTGNRADNAPGIMQILEHIISPGPGQPTAFSLSGKERRSIARYRQREYLQICLEKNPAPASSWAQSTVYDYIFLIEKIHPNLIL
jgi:hypothetical protein